MIEVSCPSCGKRYKVPEFRVGQSAPCKQCGATITVPDPSGMDLGLDESLTIPRGIPSSPKSATQRKGGLGFLKWLIPVVIVVACVAAGGWYLLDLGLLSPGTGKPAAPRKKDNPMAELLGPFFEQMSASMPVPEDTTGLPEKTRREIFASILELTNDMLREMKKVQPDLFDMVKSGKSSEEMASPEDIDIQKLMGVVVKMQAKIEEESKKLVQKHNITEQQLEAISNEGFARGWWKD